MSFLDKMIDIKKNEAKIYPKPNERIQPKSLVTSVANRNPLFVISEVKKASPSKGKIRTEVVPVLQAEKYERGGASAISVLAESEYFLGSYNDLYEVASKVSLPVLCKDFIFFPHQLQKARDYGASIVLLIAAGLEKNQLIELEAEAMELGMEVLLEIHDEEDLKKVQACQSKLVGVNNRNLKTLEVSLETTKLLLPSIDNDRIAISESGILLLEDAKCVRKAGAKGVLIGESLMKSEDPERFLKELQKL